ncbi:unnamed protein product [Amoebophrya sp. A25]|nr:unnamed protein product [Amoebophrya sp. A25]|eukprot:GSA25T00002420001.1
MSSKQKTSVAANANNQASGKMNNELGAGPTLFAGNTKLQQLQAERNQKSKSAIADTEENVSKMEASLGSLESLEEQKATSQGALSQKMLQALALNGNDVHVDIKTARVSLSKLDMGGEGGDNFSRSLLPAEWCEEWEQNLPDYPKISFPQKKSEKWSIGTMMSMVEHFKSNAAQPLHPLLIMRLLYDTEVVMAKKYPHSVNKATIPKKSMQQRAEEEATKRGENPTEVSKKEMPGLNSKAMGTAGRTIVVGDTHGQLEDVLWIFYKNGLPSPSNAYLFNGDIADRGFYATEIFALLFGFMVLYPSSVDMNRGNHEDETINLDPHCGGFYEENIQKYGGNIGSMIYESYLKVYSHLPLATVLEKRVFVVHGGLSRVTDGMLKVLAGVDHHTSSIPESPDNTADTVFIDSMWADPMEGKGIVPSNRGPSLIQFGPDVTMKFLRQNGFHLVVRSHQPPSNKDGVFFHHDGRLLTVFSASNYCGWYGNTGAVLIFSPGKGDTKAASLPTIEIVRHFSPTFQMLATADITTNDVLSLEQLNARKKGATEMEYAAIKNARSSLAVRMDKLIFEVKTRIARILVDHKQELWKFWLQHEKDGDYNSRPGNAPPGLISIDAWKEGIAAQVGSCASVVNGLPWQQVKEILNVEDPHTKLIDYPLTLHRFRVVLRDEVKTEANLQDVRKSVSTQTALFPRKTADPNGNVMRHTNWMETILARLFEQLLLENVPWQQLIAKFGVASEEEKIDPTTLQKVLSSLTSGSSANKKHQLLTSDQAAGLVRTLTGYGGSRSSIAPGSLSLSAAKSGAAGVGVTLAEFLSRLEVCYTGYNVQRLRHKAESGLKEGQDGEQTLMNLKFGTTTVATCFRLIGRAIFADADSAHEASEKTFTIFKDGDKDSDGMLSKSEFTAVVEQLLKPYSSYLLEFFIKKSDKYNASGGGNGELPASLLEDIFKVVDVARTAKISYLEFLHCFQPADRSGDVLGLIDSEDSKALSSAVNSGKAALKHLKHPAEEIRVALMEQICGVLYNNKQALHKAFMFFDKGNTRLIPKVHFVKAIKCLNITLNMKASPLTEDQIEMFADHCVLSADETIDYLHFLNNLVICDMHTGEMFD